MQPTSRKLLVGILLCGFLLRLGAVLCLDPIAGSDDKEYKEIARNLVEGGGYAIDGKPTAYRTPGYPLIIAGVYSVFGFADAPVRILQVVLDLGSCCLLFLLGRRLHSESVGCVAAGIFALFPSQVLYTCEFMSETSFTFLLLLTVWTIAADDAAHEARTNIVLGLLIGVLILIRSTAAPLPLIVMLTRLKQGASLTRALSACAVISVVAVAVMSPWVYRNYATFHRVSFSSNVGINLWIGNHEGANGSFSFPEQNNPLREFADDYDQSDVGTSAAFAYVTSHPGQYPLLLAKKWAHLLASDYWLALPVDPIPKAKEYPNAATLFSRIDPRLLWGIQVPFMIVLVFGTFGLVCSRGANRKLIFIIRALLLSWIAVHMVFFAVARHRFPVVPFLMLAAALSWHSWREQWTSCSTKQRALVLIMAAAFLAGWVAEYATLRMRTMPFP